MARIDNLINVNTTWNKTDVASSLEKTTLKIWIYKGFQGNSASSGVALGADGARPLEPTYELSSTGTDYFGSKRTSFSIAHLIKDYLRSALYSYNVIGSNSIWVDIQATLTIGGVTTIQPSEHYLGVDGYSYAIDNQQEDKTIRISNTHVLKLEDRAVQIPVLANDVKSYSFIQDNKVVVSGTQDDFSNLEYSSESQVQYLKNMSTNIDNFRDRVIFSGGVYENNKCLKEIEQEVDLMNVDKLHIESGNGQVDIITFEDVCEEKYRPRKLVFINKWGAFQELWFFANSKESVEVDKDYFNTYQSDLMIYSTNISRTNSVKQKLTLNSGYYPENNNVVFEELLQSNDVWIWTDYQDDVTSNRYIPVNVKNKKLDFKNSLTDKVINYEIDIEYAFEKMRKY